MSTRVNQGKRVNPPYRPSNPGTQFFRGCHPLDAWTGEATFSKLAETKWRERHFLGSLDVEAIPQQAVVSSPFRDSRFFHRDYVRP